MIDDSIPRTVRESAPGLAARVIGGNCLSCGEPRISHGPPNPPADPLGCEKIQRADAIAESLPIPLIGGPLLCVFCNHPAHAGKPCGVATPWCSCRA
jgi:hypothetical protein